MKHEVIKIFIYLLKNNRILKKLNLHFSINLFLYEMLLGINNFNLYQFGIST